MNNTYSGHSGRGGDWRLRAVTSSTVRPERMERGSTVGRSQIYDSDFSERFSKLPCDERRVHVDPNLQKEVYDDDDDQLSPKLLLGFQRVPGVSSPFL